MKFRHRCSIRTFLFIVFVVSFFTFALNFVYETFDLHIHYCPWYLFNNIGCGTYCLSKIGDIPQTINEITWDLKTLMRQNRSATVELLLKIEALRSRIEARLPDSVAKAKSAVDSYLPRQQVEQQKKKLVCPEIYKGSSYDYPYFERNWLTSECPYGKPLNQLVTILLNSATYKEGSEEQHIKSVLDGISRVHPGISVLVGLRNWKHQNPGEYKNVTYVTFSKETPISAIWNNLLLNVKTPYVFVGRQIFHFTWYASLERLVRVVSEIPGIVTAGAAYRNLSTHWKVGCQQSEIRNYGLRYKDGYYRSKFECMFCSNIEGPFLINTTILKELKFDENLSEETSYHDLFLRLTSLQFGSVVCPDAMHFMDDSTNLIRDTERGYWIGLAHKWQVNRIYLPSKVVYSFSCQEARLSCKGLASLTKSFLVPVCCQEQMTKALMFLDFLSRRYNLPYELESGSVLGAVKMNDLIPWDIDGDVSYLSANHSFFLESRKLFEDEGFTLSNFKEPKVTSNGSLTGGSFLINTPDMIIEMWGLERLFGDISRRGSTKVRIREGWVKGPPNPGSYARNRYGPEIYKHSQSWRWLGMKNSWQRYKTGKFLGCTQPEHHACLDRYPTDGNIPFIVP